MAPFFRAACREPTDGCLREPSLFPAIWIVASPPLSLSWLRAKITGSPHECEWVGALRGDDFTDPLFPDTLVGDVHQFRRVHLGKPVTAEIHCFHEGLPIPEEVVRTFLRRLGIDLEDLLS